MAAIHDALKTLAPVEFPTVPQEDDGLKTYLSETFKDAQLLIDSIPIPSPEETGADTTGRSRANTVTSMASSASEISLSTARPAPPPPEIEALQKTWGKPVKLGAKENPLGMSVYKLAGKDGKGAWFARRSIHQGLGFAKWKKGLEREFPETLKVQGGPGEGNIRGIGGERRVEYKTIPGVGKLEVYHLSAQFPGPTTPRDFVTLLLTSDSALDEKCAGLLEDRQIPRHFMIVSKPCIHPECPEREGFIRGQYQSVEFIREIPVTKPPHKSQSTADLMDGSHSPGRPRGKTISYSQSRGSDAKGEHIDVPEDDEAESNPVEWIMLTRSDPGGSVPRFMVERGTPGSIVADASKFLDWACSTTPEELDNNTEHFEHKEVEKVPDSQPRPTHTTKVLHDYETNGHLSGIGNARAPPRQDIPSRPEEQTHETPPTDDGGAGGGILGMVTGVVGAAGGFVAAHAPAVIANHLPGYEPAADEVYERPAPTMRRFSTSTIDSASSVGSFVSADEGKREPSPRESLGDVSINSTSSFIRDRPDSEQAKELRKLEERKRKLDEKLAKTRERELSKKSELTEKEAEEIAKAEEKHKKEVAKQEEKYRRELAKLEAKREKEERKAAEKRKKAQDKDEKARLTRELAEMKAERDILRVERDLLRKSMGELQAENTALAARLGKLGPTGEQVLKEVKDDVSSGGRLRASSLSRMIGGGRPSSLRSVDGAVATSVKESHAPPPL